MTKPLGIARPVFVAGALLGCGLGAFFDGILLHQILQWHNMLSSVRPPVDLVSMKYNMLWDGLFHAAAWVVTALGVAQLWSAGRRRDVRWSTPTFLGGALIGWGLFNFVEGVCDHQVFGIHHVHPGELQQAWDLGFLAWGLGMVGVGLLLVKRGRSDRTGVLAE